MQPKNSLLAVWSLVLGIVSLVGCSILAGIPAVICGHMGRTRIRRSAGALTGDGLALAGLITGYCSIALALIMVPLLIAIAVPNFMKAREMAMKNVCINNLRQIEGATEQWALEKKKHTGDLPTREQVAAYIKGGFPVCPKGGAYSLTGNDKRPTCSQPDHAIPQ